LLPTVFGLLVCGVYLCCVVGGGVEDGGGCYVCFFSFCADDSMWFGFLGGAWLRESASRSWNKVLRASLFFVIVCSGGGVGSVSPCIGVTPLSSSFVGLLVAFLCLLLRFVSAGQVEASGGFRSTIMTADVWLRKMCCSLPMIGVWFSIFGSVGGWSPSRCVLRAEKHRCSGERRKTVSSFSLDWVVISLIFWVLAVRFGCTVPVLSF